MGEVVAALDLPLELVQRFRHPDDPNPGAGIVQREHDIVVFGATGFVGRLTPSTWRRTARAASRSASPAARASSSRRVRSPRRRARLTARRPTADDPARCAARARASSPPPSARTAATGSRSSRPARRPAPHYGDLTGEVLFMRESIDRYDAGEGDAARGSFTACGFDSIPSDLGVLLLHEAAAADGAGELEDTTLVVKPLRGGAQRRDARLDEGAGRRDARRPAPRASDLRPVRAARTARRARRRTSATSARSRATRSSAGSARS